MTGLDGPTLRAVREDLGVPLRRIARIAAMSHGHLSKVERGEHGRPVTEAILRAYQRVTGVDLAAAAEQVAERRDRDTARRDTSWQPGEMSELRRRAFDAAVGAIAMGGPLGEPTGRLVDSTGRPVTPTPAEPGDVRQVELLAADLTTLDLAYGGGLASQVSKAVLRWAVPMLDQVFRTDAPKHARLAAAIGMLAHRTGWSAFDTGAHDAARALYRLALYAANAGQDADLRGHVLADIAIQHCQVGYHPNALTVLRLAEGDERVTPPVRMVLHGVRALVHATRGQADACHRQIEAAERAHRRAGDPAGTGEPPAGWVATVGTPGRLLATTGHALAVLAGHTGSAEHRQEAVARLAKAADQLDPVGQARAVALCLARLARLHLDAGDRDQAGEHHQQAEDLARQIRSGRLAHHLTQLRTTLHPERSPAPAGDRADPPEPADHGELPDGAGWQPR